MTKASSIKFALFTIIAISTFSWISVRPYIDRKQCNEYAVSKVKDLGNPMNDNLYNMYGRNYTLCVNSKGLAE